MTSVDQFSDHRNDTIADQPMMGKINNDDLTLRALVSTKEAGVIIGKGNKNNIVVIVYKTCVHL